jgi:hypothetical protein
VRQRADYGSSDLVVDGCNGLAGPAMGNDDGSAFESSMEGGELLTWTIVDDVLRSFDPPIAPRE